jgi:hypothetical protein
LTNLTITLPDDLAEIAQAQGLLTAAAFEAYVLEKSKASGDAVEYPPGFDPRLKGAVNPAVYRQGKILGDIVSPIDVEWEATK